MNRILISIPLLLLICCATPALAQDGPVQNEGLCFTLTDRDGVAIQLASVEDSIYKDGQLLLTIASGEIRVDSAKIRSLEFGAYVENGPISGELVLMDGTKVPTQTEGFAQWVFTTAFGKGEIVAKMVKSLVRCP